VTGRLQDRRLLIALAVLLALVVILPAWFLVISPLRADAAQLRGDAETVEVQNASLEAKTAELREKSENRDQLVAATAFSLAELPWETKLPEFSRQLAEHAERRGVELTSISIGGSSTPGQPAAEGVDPSTITQAIPVTIVSRGNGLDQRYFLRDVQELGPRRALVIATSLVPTKVGSIEGQSTMTVQLTVFSSPMDDATREELKALLGEGSTG